MEMEFRMSQTDAERFVAHLERVAREEREEQEARLHGQRHDTIDTPAECERCHPDDPRLVILREEIELGML